MIEPYVCKQRATQVSRATGSSGLTLWLIITDNCFSLLTCTSVKTCAKHLIWRKSEH